MDIELARTYLSIVDFGSFIAAANHLHVTQTTVTARVQNLESQLGCSLFIRNKSGARLTPMENASSGARRSWSRHGTLLAATCRCPTGPPIRSRWGARSV